MIVLGVAGWSGSGKTTLIARLIPLLGAAGVSVSTVKHAHDGFDLDRPGKDSWLHREAGAREVLLASSTRWALLREHRGPEPALGELLGRLAPVDLVLVEGFKHDGCPKLELHRPGMGRPPLWPDDPAVVAVASDVGLPGCPLEVLDLNDPACVAGWILRERAVLPAWNAGFGGSLRG